MVREDRPPNGDGSQCVAQFRQVQGWFARLGPLIIESGTRRATTGRRLLNENLQGSRAAYRKQILVTVSRELAAEYGRERLHQAIEHAREIAARGLPSREDQP